MLLMINNINIGLMFYFATKKLLAPCNQMVIFFRMERSLAPWYLFLWWCSPVLASRCATFRATWCRARTWATCATGSRGWCWPFTGVDANPSTVTRCTATTATRTNCSTRWRWKRAKCTSTSSASCSTSSCFGCSHISVSDGKSSPSAKYSDSKNKKLIFWFHALTLVVQFLFL